MRLFVIEIVISPATIEVIDQVLARVDEILDLVGDRAAEVALTSDIKTRTDSLARAVAANQVPPAPAPQPPAAPAVVPPKPL